MADAHEFTLFGFSCFSESNNVALASLDFSTNVFKVAARPAGAPGGQLTELLSVCGRLFTARQCALFGLQHSQSRNAA